MKFSDGNVMDKWQEEVMLHEGSMALRCGRQTGKSETISEKAKYLSLTHKKTNTLVVAASQRQSSLIFEKINAKIKEEHNNLIDKYIKKWEKSNPDKTMTKEQRRKLEYQEGLYSTMPTQTKIELLNGSKIYCLPTGKTGAYIRGFTIDFLIAEECAYIPDMVWTSLKPMIAVSQQTRGFGWEILLSTPFGKGGYFYERCHDKDFKQFHISSEKCPRISKEFLRKERMRLSKQQYAQEYLAEFIEELAQIFPTNLIKSRMSFLSWDLKKDYDKRNSYYLGVDVARFGGDENAFIVNEIDKFTKKHKIVKCFTTERKSIPDTARKIKELNKSMNFKKIFIDDNGIGGGLTDFLQEELGKKRVTGINNSSKSKTRQKAILKEDLYSNALVMMENEEIEIINDIDLMRSLKSVTFEYTSDKNLRIFGNYTHLAEAFVRACWAKKEKGLNLFVA